ncbi:MAG: hypothetical protein OXU25_00365 [Thaumarchaeota archaeon]|nr:hypothetical protein [Nitrososphaerota archaeon]
MMAAPRPAPHGGDGQLDDVSIENSVRLKCWIERLEDLHYAPDMFSEISRGARLGLAPRAPPGPSLHLLCCLRYLVLEAWQFTRIHDITYSEVVGNLDVPSPGCLHGIIQSTPGIKRLLRPMRNDFAAHSGRPMEELDAEMERVGLRNFVLYARSIVMFQDAVRALPKRSPEPEIGPGSIQKRLIEVGAGHADYVAERVSACEGIQARIDPERHPSICSAMTDRVECLNMLVLRFLRTGIRDPTSIKEQKELTDVMLDSKYMVLELDGFIEQYDRAAMEYPGLAAFCPNLLGNRDAYRRIRNGYSAHAEAGRIPGFNSLIGNNPDLLVHIIRDTLEAGALAERILPGRAAGSPRARLLTYAELHDIELELRRIRERTTKYYEDALARSVLAGRQARILGQLIEALGSRAAP